MTMTVTMTHSDKSHISRMKAWPYKQECKGQISMRKTNNLSKLHRNGCYPPPHSHDNTTSATATSGETPAWRPLGNQLGNTRVPFKHPKLPWVFFSCTPEPHVAFCPIFVHPLFPVFEPHIQKWVIFVRRRPCVCDTFRFESQRKKDRIWHRLPPPPSRGPRQLNFPNVKNNVGQKQYGPCFLRRRRRPKAGDAFTRTRLMPTFGVSAALSGCVHTTQTSPRLPCKLQQTFLNERLDLLVLSSNTCSPAHAHENWTLVHLNAHQLVPQGARCNSLVWSE